MILGQENPRLGFWVVSILGAVVVISYSLMSGSDFGSLNPMDFFLFGTISFAGLGYAASGKLVKSMGGLEIVVWGLILFSPIAFTLIPLQFNSFIFTGSGIFWLGILYIGIFSQWLGFYAWNRSLKWGGTSKVSQVALLQSFGSFLCFPYLGGRNHLEYAHRLCSHRFMCSSEWEDEGGKSS